MMDLRSLSRLVGKTNVRSASTCSVVRPPIVRPINVKNEPILAYRCNSQERLALCYEVLKGYQYTEHVPIVIGGENICEGEPKYQVMPHYHCKKIAKFYHASENTIKRAIDVAVAAQSCWDRVSLQERVNIFLRAADMIATGCRASVCAATMIGQSKTVMQAEIDAACELVDFLRWNAKFLTDNLRYQPVSPDPCTTLNSIRFRGIEGFVAAICPFNFTAIGGNIASLPALMGNAVLWKPSDTAVLSNYRVFEIFRRAGMPDGVLNFIPADGPTFGKAITESPHLAGINFTGSVPTFNWLWRAVAKNLEKYRNYPRLIGECGGKNYHFVHPSADIWTAIACTVRSAFEYCGQKCSACSRLYIPASLREYFLQNLICQTQCLRVGDVKDFSVFIGAVIDENAYNRITKYITDAKSNPKNKILAGGCFDKKYGYYIMPTIIETTDPYDKLMKEEIFGPILTVYTYDDKDLAKAVQLVGSTTQFALTGAVFAQDEAFIEYALEAFKSTAGNFYINDKSTGAVVNQQPFGGGRMSGTNDKAGAPVYLNRWTTPQAIKETFKPQYDIYYPYMCG